MQFFYEVDLTSQLMQQRFKFPFFFSAGDSLNRLEHCVNSFENFIAIFCSFIITFIRPKLVYYFIL